MAYGPRYKPSYRPSEYGWSPSGQRAAGVRWDPVGGGRGRPTQKSRAAYDGLTADRIMETLGMKSHFHVTPLTHKKFRREFGHSNYGDQRQVPNVPNDRRVWVPGHGSRVVSRDGTGRDGTGLMTRDPRPATNLGQRITDYLGLGMKAPPQLLIPNLPTLFTGPPPLPAGAFGGPVRRPLTQASQRQSGGGGGGDCRNRVRAGRRNNLQQGPPGGQPPTIQPPETLDPRPPTNRSVTLPP